MNSTRYNTRANELLGGLDLWNRQHAGDNSAQLDRLRRCLRSARKAELTPRQQQILDLYFDQGLNISQIASALHVNRSTVSRTLARAKARLYHFLQYSL